MAELGTRNRAKVYQLNGAGQWDDRGTGYAACQYLQAYGFACIILVSEEDSTPILETRVSPDDIYQRQGETIISWTEPANGCDVALSFADASGCSEFWDEIQSMQRAEAQAGGGGFGLGDGSAGGGGGGGVGGQLGGPMALAHERGGGVMCGGGCGLGGELGAHEASVNLPAPELRNVKALAEMLGEITFYQRPAVVQLILQQDYIAQLAQLFQTIEDLESLPELHAMFHIFRTLMMLNDSAIFEQLLREDVVMHVIGALEYDPELLVHATRHREFLTSVVVFREVLPIKEPSILAKVHQNFRVQYIKDVVLPRSLDDHTFATLNSIVFVNNVAILSHIQRDSEYLSALFAQLVEHGTPLERRRELSRLLLELCQLARSLQLFNRAAFYRRMLDHGLFAPVASLLMSADPMLQLHAAEMLGATCLHDPSILRQFILVERPAQRTMRALMHVLTCGAEAGVKAQLGEVLRALLDPETMEGLEQEEFLNLFYEHFVAVALAPLESAGADGEGDGGASNGGARVHRQLGATSFAASAAAPAGARGVASAAGGAEPAAAAGGAGDAPAASASATLDNGGGGAEREERASAGGARSGADVAGGCEPSADADAAEAVVGVEVTGGADAGRSLPAPAGAADTAAYQSAAPSSGGAHAALSAQHGESAGSHALADPEVELPADEEALHASRSLVVELFCFCVLHHGYRIKYFVLKNHVMAKVLGLCSLRDKPLILAAVRFVRACVGLRDEFYNRYIAKNNCLLPLVQQLAANARLDNMLASAVIELLDFIRKENLRSLLAHLYEQHREALDAIRLPDVVNALWLRHEQNLDGTHAAAPGGGAGGARGGGRRGDDDDGDGGSCGNGSAAREAGAGGTAGGARLGGALGGATDCGAGGRGAARGTAMRGCVPVAFAGAQQSGVRAAQPPRAARRAPPGGPRAFDDDDESAYFEGSDDDDDVAGQTHEPDRAADARGAVGGTRVLDGAHGTAAADESAQQRAKGGAVLGGAARAADGALGGGGHACGAHAPQQHVPSLLRFAARGAAGELPPRLPSAHFDPTLAAAHQSAMRHAQQRGVAGGGGGGGAGADPLHDGFAPRSTPAHGGGGGGGACATGGGSVGGADGGTPGGSPGHAPHALHVPHQVEELASANASTVAPAVAPWLLGAGDECHFGHRTLPCSPPRMVSVAHARMGVGSPGSPGAGARVRRLSSPQLPPDLPQLPPPAVQPPADPPQPLCANADVAVCADGLRESAAPRADGGLPGATLAPDARGAADGAAGAVGAKRPREGGAEITLPLKAAPLSCDEGGQRAI